MKKNLLWALGAVMMMGAAPAMAQVYQVSASFKVNGVQVNKNETGSSIKSLNLSARQLVAVFGFGMDPNASTSDIIGEWCDEGDSECASDVKHALKAVLALEMEGDPCNSTLVLWDKAAGTEMDVPNETAIASIGCGEAPIYAIAKFEGESVETDVNFVNFAFNDSVLVGSATCMATEKIKVEDTSDVSLISAQGSNCIGEFTADEDALFIVDGSFKVDFRKELEVAE